MHVPDGFLDAQTSILTGAIAVGALALAMRRTRSESAAELGVPMIALTATTIFAAQMVNFPVGDGVSGHLLGGALAAVLVGPAAAMLCLSLVLIVQATLFADGGVGALGTNIVLFAVVGVLVGWGVFLLAVRLLPERRWSLAAAAGAGALASVPAAALVFSALFAVAGAAAVDVPALFAAMFGWHLLIGVGEAAITALVLSAMLAVRPDLAYAARIAPRLRARPAPVGGGAPAPVTVPA